MQNLRRSSLSDGGASASRGVPGTPKNQKMRASARGGTLKGNECDDTDGFFHGRWTTGLKRGWRTTKGKDERAFRFVSFVSERFVDMDAIRRADGWMVGWMDADGGKQTRKTRADAKKIEPTE